MDANIAVVTLILTVLGQFGAIVWFAATIRASVKVLDSRADHFAKTQHEQSQAINGLATAVQVNAERIAQNRARLEKP